MTYCDRCKEVFEEENCPVCGKNDKCREPEDDDFCLVGEFDRLWGETFINALRENKIPFIIQKTAGVALSTIFAIAPNVEQMRIFVPYSRLAEAEELAGLFDEDLSEEYSAGDEGFSDGDDDAR